MTVEPIKYYDTYVTITLEGKEIDHIKCKDFQFIYDDYQGYLRFTTETIPSDLFRCYRKHGNETLFDIVAYGVQHGSQIRIDAKGSKLISGVNIDSNKPIELYFQVSDDYILDIT